jgi:hypothetical protein
VWVVGNFLCLIIDPSNVYTHFRNLRHHHHMCVPQKNYVSLPTPFHVSMMNPWLLLLLLVDRRVTFMIRYPQGTLFSGISLSVKPITCSHTRRMPPPAVIVFLKQTLRLFKSPTFILLW